MERKRKHVNIENLRPERQQQLMMMMGKLQAEEAEEKKQAEEAEEKKQAEEVEEKKRQKAKEREGKKKKGESSNQVSHSSFIQISKVLAFFLLF